MEQAAIEGTASNEFDAWAKQRMVRNIALSYLDLDSSPYHLPAIRAKWDGDMDIISSVDVQWYRLPPPIDGKFNRRARVKIEGGTASLLVLTANEYDKALEVELRPNLKEGGQGPVARKRTTAAWKDENISKELANILGGKEATFRMVVIRREVCSVIVTPTAVTVKQGVFKSPVTVGIDRKLHVEPSQDPLELSVWSDSDTAENDLKTSQRYVLKAPSPLHRDVMVLTLRHYASLSS